MDAVAATVAAPWEDLTRSSAHVRHADLAPLTLVCALPGWGGSTWMRQLGDYLELTDGCTVRWLRSRPLVDKALKSTETHHADVIVIDDLTMTAADPLWPAILGMAATDGAPALVVRCLDLPLSLEREAAVVITEADLALSLEDIEQLSTLNQAAIPPGLHMTLASRYRGNPSIVRQRLERSTPGAPMRLAHSDARLDVDLAADLAARLTHIAPAMQVASPMLNVLRQACGSRRVSLGVLHADGFDDATLREQFTRLTTQPFGTLDLDVETGETVLDWSDEVWALLGRIIDPTTRRELRERTLAASRATGHITMQLMTLLALSRYGEADRLVFDHFRFLSEQTPALLARAVTSIPLDAIRACPSLCLLAGHVRLTTPEAVPSTYSPYFDRAIAGYARREAADAVDTLRIALRRAYASVSNGDRAGARRSLALVTDILASDADDSVLALAATRPDIARTLTAEAYLGMWAATQLDDHDFSREMATVMIDHHDPLSKTAAADLHYALMGRVFAGVITDTPHDTVGAAITDALVALDNGDESTALGIIDYVGALTGYAPSASAAEGFILAVRALVAPHTLDAHVPATSLATSQGFWTDGRPSSFIVAATSLAMLVRGEARGALALVDDHGRRAGHDWFTAIAQALALLALDEPVQAAERLRAAEAGATSPRPRAVNLVIAAMAQSRLGHDGAARELLATALSMTGPRMTRFALRCVPAADIEQWRAGPLDDPLRATLDLSAGDTHAIPRHASIVLTAIERELVEYIRDGLTYPQIAQRRFVSINTVRTQARGLLRKLGAADRVEAVAVAAELGLIGTRTRP